MGALLLPRDESGEASVRVEPAEALLDAPFRLVVDGAGAGETIDLTLSSRAGSGERWSARRSVRADDAGSVDVDAGALLASLRPEGSPDAELASADGTWTFELEAREGQRRLGSAQASRSVAAADVTQASTTVAEDGFAGRLWSGARDGRSPVAVVLLGGSEGGFTGSGVASLLAARGYTVLQLAYFREKGLPQQLRAIPLEYVARALTWVGRRPGVDPSRVVVVGISRGGELALVAGSRFPELVGGVVAYAPSEAILPGTDGRSPAWTLGGRPLVTEASPDPRIPVERIRGPLLTVAGGDDGVWPAAYASSAIVERRRAHGRTDTEEVVSEDAGHGVGAVLPYLPGPTEVQVGDLTFALGGTPKADALARTAAWRKLLALLDDVSR